MADLGSELAEMLDREFPALDDVKTPITQRRGLLARMEHLERRYGSPKAAAAAAGVSPDSWRRWKRGRQKPMADSLEKVRNAAAKVSPGRYAAARRALRPGAKVRICAVIEWGGQGDAYYNPTRYRCTKLDGLDLRAIVAYWARSDLRGLGRAFERAVSRSYYGGNRGGQWDTEGVLPIQFHGDRVTVELVPRAPGG